MNRLVFFVVNVRVPFRWLNGRPPKSVDHYWALSSNMGNRVELVDGSSGKIRRIILLPRCLELWTVDNFFGNDPK